MYLVNMKLIDIITLVVCVSSVFAQKDPHFVAGRNTIVHLFEWRWSDIAAECENYLGPNGYAGVQVSPPNENLIITSPNRPWWERYQPISYNLTTRSGNEADFANMVKRCNAAGVRIYIDAVINHMTALSGTGTGGSTCNAENKDFPAVPFNSSHFHATCNLNDQDATSLRNCELNGLRDLDHSISYVRQKIVAFFDHLVDLGVAGFRVDAAKLMWPVDLEAIYETVKNLNTEHNFPENARPFFYQEVIDFGGDVVSKTEYNSFGAVLEFVYGTIIGGYFQRQNGAKLADLSGFGPSWGMLDSNDAVVFIDNHDNQRHGTEAILTYKNSKPYKAAIAFMLAHPAYAITRIMSSFDFTDADIGPPMDSSGNVIGPGFTAEGTCTNGWVCEHRWREINSMIAFRNVVSGTDLNNWWSNGDQQIAFGRGSSGFIVFTLAGDVKQSLKTNLPAGTYCDVISGDFIDGSCTGRSIKVDANGMAAIDLNEEDFDAYIAIHTQAKL